METAGISERDHSLRDGRTVHLRAVAPVDEAEFLQAFERLSDEARYMRFMRIVHAPNREQLRATLASFPEAGIGLVATVPADDGLTSSAARLPSSADRAVCEFAITVAAGFGESASPRH
jgi:hypothetical protein